MALYRDEAIVLYTHKLSEADKIVTMLTKENGKVDGVAKSVRKTKSRFAGSLEPFTQLQIQLYTGKNLDTITQTSVISSFGFDIAKSYDDYLIANIICETADKIIQEKKEPATEQYNLLLGALYSLSRKIHKSELILNSYILRALSIAGWEPGLDACVKCGSVDNLCGFSLDFGGVVCKNDKKPTDIDITSEEIYILNNLLSGSWNKLGDAEVSKNLNVLIAAFLQYCIERKIKSYRYKTFS